MDKPMPNVAFNVMSSMFKVMDVFRSSDGLLGEIKIRAGYTLLDYGCGPGRYEPLLSEQVGPWGTVYALDIHPLAVRKVEKLAEDRGSTNVETILSACETGLSGESVDVVLLLDIFHMLSEPERVLAELHRVLKPGGLLACSIHHVSEEEAIEQIVATGLFELSGRGKKVLNFTKR
jgi:ubiquinone/menaquinone biosynthesis C-methylase UbiE